MFAKALGLLICGRPDKVGLDLQAAANLLEKVVDQSALGLAGPRILPLGQDRLGQRAPSHELQEARRFGAVPRLLGALGYLNFLLGDGRVSGSRRGGLSGKNSFLPSGFLGLGSPFTFAWGFGSSPQRLAPSLTASGPS